MQKIAIVSQKGGVGKSSLAASIAITYTKAGWEVLIADMDLSQRSLVEWDNFRSQNQIVPQCYVHPFSSVKDVIKNENYDLIIFDGAPHSTYQTKEIASLSDIVIIPTSCSIMDLNPQIRLAHELSSSGINSLKLTFVLMKTGASKSETLEAREYIQKAGYAVCEGDIPEKTSFRRAFIEGKALVETSWPTLQKACAEVMQCIVNRVNELTI